MRRWLAANKKREQESRGEELILFCTWAASFSNTTTRTGKVKSLIPAAISSNSQYGRCRGR